MHKDSIDLSQAWFQSRYDKGDGKDYINCPMDRAQYEHFIQELIDGDKTKFKEWETSTPYFEGCLPIEVMAERGPKRFDMSNETESVSPILIPAAKRMRSCNSARTMRSARYSISLVFRPN